MSTNTFPPCCLKHFTWSATPTGTTSTLGPLSTYIASPPSTSTSAVLYIHDALGWTFPNARLLCDHFAKEANVTVYMPDFFGGEELERTALLEGRWGDIDMVGFQKRNSREVREPEIFAAAKELRGKYEKLGTVGYCFGGWAVLRLGAKEHEKEKPLVDCVVCAHPSWVTKEDIDNYGIVPIQFLAPEIDGQFPDELKMHAFQTLVMGRKGDDGVPVEWMHFPRVAHACLTKGDEKDKDEREALIRGKDAAVGFFRQWLS